MWRCVCACVCVGGEEVQSGDSHSPAVRYHSTEALYLKNVLHFNQINKTPGVSL